MPMISSIYARDPQDMRQRVAEHRARGYLGHSIKVGASLVDKRPGEYFIVDANGGFIPETALRMLRLLPPGFDFVLEAPCATWRETMSLRQRCPYPIIADELAQQDEDTAWAIANDAADGIGLKISKAGGLTRGRRHRDIARAAGLTISVQETAGSAIAFAAITHLGATVPPRLLRCVLNRQDMVTVDTAKFDAVHQDGGVLPPDLPGLGIDVNEGVLGEPVAVWGE